MKTFSKISIGLLSLLALSISSCKKDMTPLPGSQKLASLSPDSVHQTVIYYVVDNSENFFDPTGIAVDAAGNIYIADNGDHQLIKFDSHNVITPIAGGPITNFGTKDGTGYAASFQEMGGLSFGPDGNLYITDPQENIIRKITPGGTVTTIAGLVGMKGHIDGPEAHATFNVPNDAVFDAAGNMYISDFLNNSVRVINICATVKTLAGLGGQGFTNGPGPIATFAAVLDVAVDHKGNVFVADGNNVIRKITPDGTVSTFAGSGKYGTADGVGTAASFGYPTFIKIDSNDNLFVYDESTKLLRKITQEGAVTTFARETPNGVNLTDVHGMNFDRLDNLYITHGRSEYYGEITKIATR
jgi:sugar lactone lactonase YvrE